MDEPLTPEQAREIKMRTPFHLQRGHRSRVFVTGGKVLAEATAAEIEALNRYEDEREKRSAFPIPPR